MYAPDRSAPGLRCLSAPVRPPAPCGTRRNAVPRPEKAREHVAALDGALDVALSARSGAEAGVSVGRRQ
jgi:hypothetical protein